MTEISGERRVWIFAITVSLAIHGLAVLFMPVALSHSMQEPIMRVHFEMRPEQKAVVAVAQEKTEPIRKPSVRPDKTGTAHNPVGKQIKPMQNEISITPSDLKSKQPSESVGSETGVAGVSRSSESGPGIAGVSGSGASASGMGDTLVEVDSLQIIKKVIPEYPAFSRKRKEEGIVKIIITIDNGRVLKAEVEQSCGFARLDSSALRAVKQWLFDHNGIVRARVPISFKLEK